MTFSFNPYNKTEYACFMRARRVRMLWWSREAIESRKRNGTPDWDDNRESGEACGALK